jgi:hypothetical protein
VNRICLVLSGAEERQGTDNAHHDGSRLQDTQAEVPECKTFIVLPQIREKHDCSTRYRYDGKAVYDGCQAYLPGLDSICRNMIGMLQ